MDAEERFWATAKETLAALIRKNKPLREWTSDDGRVIKGWQVKSWDRPAKTEGSPGRGWWRESWGNGCTILSDHGDFWEYSFDATDEQNKSTELTHYLRETPGPYLVGSRGKPFSEMTELLERLPYL
jgi:hypothetical protein